MTAAPDAVAPEVRGDAPNAVHMQDLAHAPKKRRSGSANRQRQAAVFVRLLPEQLARLTADANVAHMSVPAYLLAGRLAEETAPRRRRNRATVDDAALMRALVAFNRANNNLSQLVRIGNTLVLFAENHGGHRLPEGVRELSRAVDTLCEQFAAPVAAILEAVKHDREG